jgi:hypothetical protein
MKTNRKANRKVKKTLKRKSRKGNQDNPQTTLKKLQALAKKAAKREADEIAKAEAQAIADYNAEERLSGWKVLNKTWTRGQIARFKAAKYVNDLRSRIATLNKEIGGEKMIAIS